MPSMGHEPDNQRNTAAVSVKLGPTTDDDDSERPTVCIEIDVVPLHIFVDPESILDSADGGLHAEGLEFGGLLLITDERCDFQRLGCRALEESSEDRSANIA